MRYTFVIMQPIIEKATNRRIGASEKILQIFLLLLIVLGIWLLFNQSVWVPKLVHTITANDPVKVEETVLEPLPITTDYKSLTHMVGGHIVTMEKGHNESAVIANSNEKIITEYFGNDAIGDLNHDGKDDIAFLLTQSEGGSGTFFYVAAALKTDTGYIGTNSILLGDRIAPQSTEIKDSKIIVSYTERKPDEPMTAKPSVAVSKSITVHNGTLFEIPQE